MFSKGIIYLAIILISSSLKANIGQSGLFQPVEFKATNSLEQLTSERETLDEVNIAKSNEELYEFYTNEYFSTGLYSKIHAEASLVEADIEYDIQSDLKDILPNKCDILVDQISFAVRSNVSPALMDGARDIKKACPEWASLSEDDRKDFYVALVTSMALAESSCNNKIKNRSAPNGTAYGLWQSTKPLSPVRGAKWVMSQIDSQVQKSGLLFWGNSNLNYWAVLNPNIHAHKVKRLLKQIPSCVVKAMAEPQ